VFAAYGVQAAEPVFDFNIQHRTLASALVDIAIAARLSISTAAARNCFNGDRNIVGRLTVRRALGAALDGSGCDFRQVGARAFEITRDMAAVPAKPVPAPTRMFTSLSQPAADLVVVATRRATPAGRLAYGVSAVQGMELAAQGVDDSSGLAQLVPAMTVTNLGMGRDKILLRGLSDGPLTGSAQSMVGIYLDDVRLTFNAPDPDLRLVDVERIEVLRGPQGALYGAGSLGGVVHIVTAPPDRDRTEVALGAAAGVTAGGAPSRSVDATINVPLIAGRIAARLVAYDEVQGGYINDPQLGLNSVNRSLRDGIRLTLAADLSGRWSVKAGGILQNINSADTQYTDASEPAYSRDNRVREPHDNDFGEAHLQALGRLSWGSARGSLAVIHHSLTSRYDAATNPPLDLPRGPAAFDERDDIKSLVGEFVLTSRSLARTQWLAGAFLADTRQIQQVTLTRLTPTPVLADGAQRRDNLKEAALFGEITVPLSQALHLTLGGRLFSYTDTVTSEVNAFGVAAVPVYSGESIHRGFAPKAVVSYTLSSAVLAYVQASEGYRGGGVNTAEVPGETFVSAATGRPARAYASDELWSFEAGVVSECLDHRLRLRAAAFQVFWNGVQSDQLLPSGLPYTANLGNGRNTGLEAEARYRAGALELSGSFMADHPELTRANPGFSSLTGSGLGAAPNFAANATAHYAWPLATRRRIELDARASYVGTSQLTLDTATTRTMGGYATGRLSASLASDHWRLTAALDNPTNTQGDTFAYGNPFTVRTTRQVTPLRPRTFSISVQASY